MVSNFERILAEIRKEARTCEIEDPEAVVNLIMEIVDLEDTHRVKAVFGINQKMKGMIKDATQVGGTREEDE